MLRKLIFSLVFISIFVNIVGCTNISNKTDETIVKNDKDKNQTQNWNESSLFSSGGFTMIGEEGRLGFIYDDSEVVRFYPNKTQKYMWHFWGKKQDFDGVLKVIATHETGGKPVTVLEGRPLGGPNNGADRHVPSSMSLPNSGIWKLDAYIGNKLFGSVFVKVYKNN